MEKSNNTYSNSNSDDDLPPLISDLEFIFTALDFAAKKHRDQRRKDPHGTPYINHPIGVAYNLIKHGKNEDADTIIAAILHDTIEDTDTSYEELVENFGVRIANIVQECTDDKDLPKLKRKRLQIENASHKSESAACVKMSDKLYNLSDLEANPPAGWLDERVDEYFAWAKRVTDQLGHHNNGLSEELNKVYDRNERRIKKAKLTCFEDEK